MSTDAPTPSESSKGLRERLSEGYRVIEDAFTENGRPAPIKAVRSFVNLGGQIVHAPSNYLRKRYGDDYKKQGNFIFQMGNVALTLSILPVAGVVLFGATALLPPLLAVTAGAAAFREFSIYMNERLQLKDLKIKHPSTADIIKRMKKAGISPGDPKEVINDYMFGQEKTFESLYALREELLASYKKELNEYKESLNEPNVTEEKKEAIKKKIKEQNDRPELKAINDIIEKLSKREIVSEQDYAMVAQIGEKVGKPDLANSAKENVEKFEAGRKKFQGMAQEGKLPNSLVKRMKNYAKTCNRIYAQDLPSSVKQELIAIACNDKKIEEFGIRALYDQIKIHYRVTENYKSPYIEPFNLKKEKKKEIAGEEQQQKMGLIERAKYKARVKAEKSAEKAADKIKEKLLKPEADLTDEQKKRKEDFSQRYGALDIVKDCERRAYLKKSVPRRLANVGIGLVSCGLAIGITVATVTGVGAAAMALNVISYALTAVCLGNGLNLEYKAYQSAKKVNEAKQEMAERVAMKGIVPSPEMIAKAKAEAEAEVRAEAEEHDVAHEIYSPLFTHEKKERFKERFTTNSNVDADLGQELMKEFKKSGLTLASNYDSSTGILSVVIENDYIERFPFEVKERIQGLGERKESSGITKFNIDTKDEDLTKFLISFCKQAVTPPRPPCEGDVQLAQAVGKQYVQPGPTIASRWTYESNRSRKIFGHS